jgi:hypothetical protein
MVCRCRLLAFFVIHEIAVNVTIGPTVVLTSNVHADMSYAHDSSIPPYFIPLLQRGPPFAPPDGYDIWRLAASHITLRRSSTSSAVEPQVDICNMGLATPTTFRNDLNRVPLADSNPVLCSAIVSTSCPYLALADSMFAMVSQAVNLSCGNACWSTLTNPQANITVQGFAAGFTGMLCPLACRLADMPNVSFTLPVGNPEDTADYDFTLVPADYAIPINVTSYASRGAQLQMGVNTFTAVMIVPGSSIPSSARASVTSPTPALVSLLGAPFLRAYYVVFDQGNTRIGLASTSAVQPSASVYGPGASSPARGFWGSSLMWGVIIGVIVGTVVVFGCFVIVRDRRRELRSRQAAQDMNESLLANATGLPAAHSASLNNPSHGAAAYKSPQYHKASRGPEAFTINAVGSNSLVVPISPSQPVGRGGVPQYTFNDIASLTGASSSRTASPANQFSRGSTPSAAGASGVQGHSQAQGKSSHLEMPASNLHSSHQPRVRQRSASEVSDYHDDDSRQV